MALPCAICGGPINYEDPSDAAHPWSFVIDERYPVSRFREFGYATPEEAASDLANLQPAHWACNARKSAKTMQELKNLPVKNLMNVSDGDW